MNDMSNINITKFTADVNNIQALSDRPNTADGITAQQLKEKFDKAGADIKLFLNNSLIEETKGYLNEAKSHIEALEGLMDGVDSRIDTIEGNYVQTSDSRLTNSRQCNNSFDSWSTARSNLKIGYGTSLPGSGDNGSIFFLY